MILFWILCLIHVSAPASAQDPFDSIESATCGLQWVPQRFLQGAAQFPMSQSGSESVARVYGGEEVEPQEYPWTVRIFARIAGQFETCTGTIINRYWIIAAAHCFVQPTFDPVTFRVTGVNRAQPQDVMIHVGMFGRPKEPRNRPSITVFPDRILAHQEYVQAVITMQPEPADLSLVRLRYPLVFTATTDDNRFIINSICLPRLMPEMNGRHTAAGYGNLDRDNQNLEYLLMTMQYDELHTYDWCWNFLTSWIPAFIYQVTNEQIWQWRPNVPMPQPRKLNICGVNDGNKSLCPGDSGGPLMTQRDDPDQDDYLRWELTGVNSAVDRLSRPMVSNLIRDRTGRINDALATRVMTAYDRVYPCGFQPIFIVVRTYASWIQTQIAANTPEGVDYAQYYLIGFTGVGVAGGLGAAARARARQTQANVRVARENPVVFWAVVIDILAALFAIKRGTREEQDAEAPPLTPAEDEAEQPGDQFPEGEGGEKQGDEAPGDLQSPEKER